MSAEVKISHSHPQVLELAKDLIKIPSITGNQEASGQVLNRIKAELVGYSFEEFVDPNTQSKSLVFYNTKSRPEKFRILLNGHVDVVPGTQEQFTPTEENGTLMGRGAQDMKSSVAAQVMVFKEVGKNVSYPLALQIVTDEETGGAGGTRYQVDTQKVAADFVIGGESTNLAICTERKGFQRLRLHARGKAAHSAYLYQGENAAVKLSDTISHLAKTYPIPKEGEWKTTLNVAALETSNKDFNVVPEDATALLDIRHIPSDTPESIIQKIQKIAPEKKGFSLETVVEGDPMHTDNSHPDVQLLARAITDVSGKPAEFIRRPGGSDARFFTRRGMPAVDFGIVGNYLHGENEYAEIQSIHDYATILSHFLRLVDKS